MRVQNWQRGWQTVLASLDSHLADLHGRCGGMTVGEEICAPKKIYCVARSGSQEANNFVLAEWPLYLPCGEGACEREPTKLDVNG